MRTSAFTRGGALLAAAALVMTLGAPPASAADTSQANTAPAAASSRSDDRVATGSDFQGSVAAGQRVSAAAIADVTRIKGFSTQLSHPDYNYIDLEIDMTNQSDVDSVDVNLSIEGVAKGSFPVYYDEDEDVLYIEIPRTIGLGKAKFTGTTVTYTSDMSQSVDSTSSNSFYVRKYITAKNPALKYSYTSTKKAFYPKGIKIFVPSTGLYKSLGKITLQYKSSSKSSWKTKKTITLDANGNGSYKFTTSKKYYYRIYAPVSATSGGLYTFTSPKF